jgi:hypothetical protein
LRTCFGASIQVQIAAASQPPKATRRDHQMAPTGEGENTAGADPDFHFPRLFKRRGKSVPPCVP